MKNSKRCLSMLYVALSMGCGTVSAKNVEVLHWWTSGGEAEAAQVLKQTLEEQGYQWQDFAIAGGGGETAMTVLKTRAVSGNPPEAAQIKGPDIQEWGRLGFLVSLDDVSQQHRWDELIPEVIANSMKYQSHYVAVPLNIHRVNWLWANTTLLRDVGITQPPTTLQQFFQVAERIKQAGHIPLAHGGQPWQDVTLFEVIALDVLGPEMYRQAFVDNRMDVLSGEHMVEVFTQFKRMHDYIDPNYRGRDWNVATAMVIQGKAAMQLMGDWAKGEFIAAGKKPGIDYLCVPALGTTNEFSYNVDSFAFFEMSRDIDTQAQKALANTIFEPEFQKKFNRTKGSIPIRSDISLDSFDSCAKASKQAFMEAERLGGLVPSMSQGMSTTTYVQSAIFEVVSDFFNNPDGDPEQAAQALAKAVNAAL
ncbi:ABC transporter substrate-binding protein [Vibrio hippocampi]|nr:ABC transporter substrate-binding protein [Vibrio hippocampi]